MPAPCAGGRHVDAGAIRGEREPGQVPRDPDPAPPSGGKGAVRRGLRFVRGRQRARRREGPTRRLAGARAANPAELRPRLRRAPLRAARGPGPRSSLLADAERVRDLALHQLALLDDVLDLARLEHGSVPLRTEPVDAIRVLGDVAAAALPLVQRGATGSTSPSNGGGVGPRRRNAAPAGPPEPRRKRREVHARTASSRSGRRLATAPSPSTSATPVAG